MQVETVGVGAAHDHREGVVEAEAGFDFDLIFRRVELRDGGEDLRGVFVDGLLEDSGQGGAGVFDVGVDAAADEGLMAEVAAGEVEAAVYFVRLAFGLVDGFDLLGEEFAEDDLFGEVFGADGDAGAARGGAGTEKNCGKQAEQ